MRLAYPTPEILDALGPRVIECGAGDGHWLRAMRDHGIDAIGIDRYARSPDVIEADHTALGQYRDRLLLVVWPPDATDLQEWVDAWGGERLAVIGDPCRFTMPRMVVERRLAVDGDKAPAVCYVGRG